MASGSGLPAATTAAGIVASGLSSPDINAAREAAAAATGELVALLAGMAADSSTAEPGVIAAAMAKESAAKSFSSTLQPYPVKCERQANFRRCSQSACKEAL